MKLTSTIVTVAALFLGTTLACKQRRDVSALRDEELPAPTEEADAPDNRSLFDAIIAENGGEVPFPFEDLVAKVRGKLTSPDATSSGILIPVGRSLLRTQADWNNPRMIFAVTTDNKRRPAPTDHVKITVDGKERIADGRLFMGYIEPTNQVEVISWNEGAGRYEFQLIKDYKAGGTKTLANVDNRETCLTCHQNEGPIFPNRFWDETNKISDTDRVWRKLCETKATIQQCEEGETPKYHGFPLFVQTNVVNGFHTAVESGHRLVTLQRLWNVEWPGATCRKEILLRALAITKKTTPLPAVSNDCRQPAPSAFVHRFELLSPFNPFDTRLGLGATPAAPRDFDSAVLRQYSPQIERVGRALNGTDVAEWLAKLIAPEGGLSSIDPAVLGPKLDSEAGRQALTRGIIHPATFLATLAAVQTSASFASSSASSSSTATSTSTTSEPAECQTLGNAETERGYDSFPARRLMFHYCSECHNKDSDNKDFVNPERSDDDFRAQFADADFKEGMLRRITGDRMPPSRSASGRCFRRDTALKAQLLEYVRGLGASSSAE